MSCTTDLLSQIQAARLEKGYTQQYLGDKLGITQNCYSKLESGVSQLTIDNFFAIAAVLEIDEFSLFFFQCFCGTKISMIE